MFVNAPQEAPEQPLPETDHATPTPPTSFVTVAVTARVCPIVRPPRFGEIVTLTVPVEDMTVMVALAFLLVSRTDVAVRVIVGLAGTDAGAV